MSDTKKCDAHCEDAKRCYDLLRRTLGRIQHVDDPRAKRAAGEIKRELKRIGSPVRSPQNAKILPKNFP